MTRDKANPAVSRIANFINRLHRAYWEAGSDAAAIDALLCFLYALQAQGKLSCSTDVVRARRFGTLPTVTARIHKLVTAGLVRVIVGDDRRVRMLEVTAKGVALLAERDKLYEPD